MLCVKTLVQASPIHGHGLFAAEPIAAGTVVWEFAAPDCRVPRATAAEALMHFGYVNPANPQWLVVCGDASRWWNFADEPNCGELYSPTADAEAPLVARRDIAMGEELTLGVETDADAARKLGAAFQPLNQISHAV